MSYTDYATTQDYMEWLPSEKRSSPKSSDLPSSPGALLDWGVIPAAALSFVCQCSLPWWMCLAWLDSILSPTPPSLPRPICVTYKNITLVSGLCVWKDSVRVSHLLHPLLELRLSIGSPARSEINSLKLFNIFNSTDTKCFLIPEIYYWIKLN